ncbi:MAG: hypothetical protein EXR72_10235 [Myxococcales bacterium]|nr:hypothetical protein [Myxococcales bacterium]
MPLEKINPRHLREKYQDWIGKRVNVGLTTYHYICGTWKETTDDQVVFQIGGNEMRVPIAEIATISDAPTWQAEFFK